ncbi:hypothetical protein [Streptomyces sp. NWU49]|uniref:hypothetical protein n=1 Tax=Streptomyces sp. NWU49 TaxID=2201153 RepID=UPI0015E829DB|nr:hypothetical protein [Streptomyces sp. NWU49]
MSADIRDRSGNPLALPVSSAARIVNRDAVPADEQQLRASLTGCGVPPEKHAAWTAAFAKISSAPSAATAAQGLPQERTAFGRHAKLRRLLRTASAPAGGPASPPGQGRSARIGEQAWRRFFELLLPPAALEEALASGLQSYLVSAAARNGKALHAPVRWQPDLLAAHNRTPYTVVEVKSSSRRDGGNPPAGSGGAVRPPRNPAGGAPPAALARQARSKVPATVWMQRPRPDRANASPARRRARPVEGRHAHCPQDTSGQQTRTEKSCTEESSPDWAHRGGRGRPYRAAWGRLTEVSRQDTRWWRKP